MPNAYNTTTIKIVCYKTSREIETIYSHVVPNVGEQIWIDVRSESPDSRVIRGRIFDLDRKNKRFIVTLMVE